MKVDASGETRIGEADAAAAVRTERAVLARAGGEVARHLLGIGDLLDLVTDQHGDRAAGRAPAGFAVAIGDGDRCAGKPQFHRPAEAAAGGFALFRHRLRSEEHTSELQSLMRISYAVFCLTKK